MAKAKHDSTKRSAADHPDAAPASPAPSSPPHLAAAYAEWTKVRAELAALDAAVCSGAVDDVTDAAVNAAIDADRVAAWRIIKTPSHNLADVRRRAVIVQMMFTDAQSMGEPTDNRHLAALSGLITEILSPIPD